MGINVEWIINKAKQKIYAVSHAKAVIRGNHTIDDDLTNLENSMETHTHDERYYTESEIDTRLGDKLDKSLRGISGGIAELDDTGKVPSSQLPSYVDDVIEYNSISEFPTIGEGGKIYIEKSTNQTYRWSGSDYVSISQSIALGETSSTAYAGDKGKNLANSLNTHINNSNLHVTDEEKTTWNNKVDKSELPTSLPANGGRADAANAAYHQVEHFLESGTDVLAYVTSDICPAPFNTIVRIMHSPTCPTNYGYSSTDNDFFYLIFKLNNSWATVKAFDIRGNVEFINSCLNGTWSGWQRTADGGNAVAVNGLTVQTAVPANAVFTDTVYSHPSGTAKTGNPTANQTPAFGGTFTVTQFTSNATGHISAATDRTVKIPNTAASASSAGLVSTGAQTFAGNKTFNGQIIPAGASDITVAQSRKIYAGTTDLTAGSSALETGAIYVVYE